MILTSESIQQLQQSLGHDLTAFLPELILCGSIVLMLLMRLFDAFRRLHLGWVALVFTLAALAVSWDQWQHQGAPTTLFSGLLAYDAFFSFLRLFLFGTTALLIWLTLATGIPDREDSADFYCLLLGSAVGMSLMASANHLLMVFMAVEMASLPSYALAGFLKGRRQSSEASLKYVVYGGGASGVMLYGISLIAGRFGTAYLPDVADGFSSVLATEGALGSAANLALLLGMLFVFIGICFKLSAVPFHFWCPDVFEGASAEVAAFLSVASKGAALALAARFVLTLTGPTNLPDPTAWKNVAQYLVPSLAFLAAITATFGNLAAYMQTNLKRLLAYSTIAHAGYMMMGLATLTADGVAAVLFYLVVYVFTNLGAFAVVAFLRNQTGSEDLASFRGLVQRSPWMVITLIVFLLSLLGLPPLAGFFGKFLIFLTLFQAGNAFWADSPNLSIIMYALLVIGGLNTVVSAFYYVKVIKVMALETTLEEVENRTPAPLKEPAGAIAYVFVMALVTASLFLNWSPLADAGAQSTLAFKYEMVSPPPGTGPRAAETVPGQDAAVARQEEVGRD